MHPAFYWWAKHARRHGHGHEHDGWDARAGCGPGGFGRSHHGRGHHGHGHEPRVELGGHGHGPGPDEGPFGGMFGGPFGVRRPLRFLAHKLDLSEPQIADLARIVDELKTERAQAEVDHRRTVAAFADAVEGASFDDARAREGAELRVKSAERLREALIKALGRIHALLDDDQRKRFAYLIRTGVLSL